MAERRVAAAPDYEVIIIGAGAPLYRPVEAAVSTTVIMRLGRGRWRGVTHEVGAGRAVRRDDDVDRCIARLGRGPG